MPNKASALWTGDLTTGRGTFTAGDSLSADYSFKEGCVVSRALAGVDEITLTATLAADGALQGAER